MADFKLTAEVAIQVDPAQIQKQINAAKKSIDVSIAITNEASYKKYFARKKVQVSLDVSNKKTYAKYFQRKTVKVKFDVDTSALSKVSQSSLLPGAKGGKAKTTPGKSASNVAGTLEDLLKVGAGASGATGSRNVDSLLQSLRAVTAEIKKGGETTPFKNFSLF